MKKCMIIVAFILVLTACSSVPTKTVDLIESTDVQSDNPSPSPLPQKFTPIPETPPVVPKEAILFKQDFETGSYLGMNLNPNDWAVNLDGSGNHSLCNKSLDYFHSFDTGYSIYDNYAIEVNVKPIAMKDNPYVTLYARYDIEKKTGYWGALSFDNLYYSSSREFANNYFTDGYIQTSADQNYLLRLEVFGTHINYFINNQLVGEAEDSNNQRGMTVFTVSPYLQLCVDNIREWALDDSGKIADARTVLIPLSPLSTQTADDLKKYEAEFNFDFVEKEGGLAPIRDYSTEGGSFVPRPGDPREVITLDETYQIEKGESVLLDYKIIIVKPKKRGDINVYGTLTITNSLLIWNQTEHQQTRLRVKDGGKLIVDNSYCFSANQYWLNWEFEDGSTIYFDHFVNGVWSAIHGSVNYTATNYSTVGLTFFMDTHNSKVNIADSHSLWLEINPTEGNRKMTLPSKRQWVDWNLNDLWTNTTVNIKHSYLLERDVSINNDVHLTIYDVPDGLGLGWGVRKESPGFIDCELNGLGEPGNNLGKYYANMTWDLPCNNSSLTLINSSLMSVWPGSNGYVHLRIYDSNLADTRNEGYSATMEIYNSTIGILAAYNGGLVYVENSIINDAIEVKDTGTRIYGFNISGNYEILETEGGKYIQVEKSGIPW